jgi:hypothetical protein
MEVDFQDWRSFDTLQSGSADSNVQGITGQLSAFSISVQQMPVDFEQHEDGTGIAFRQQLQWCIDNEFQISKPFNS